jgi:UDPglucose 6-dehydrogenase
VKEIAAATFAASALEAVAGADALIVATEWTEFANIDFAALKDTMATPMVFDGRNLFDPQTMETLGFHYHSIGRRRVAAR